MQSSEANFWKMIRRNTKKLGIHWVRVENGCEPGTPDVNGCFQGHEVWIELKIAKANKVNLSPEQVIWLHRRAAHSGRAWILCQKDNDIRCWAAHKAALVKENGWKYSPDYEWSREKNAFPWLEIVATLFK